MKKYLLKLGNWLVRKYGPPPEPPKVVYVEPEKQYLPPLDPEIVAMTKGLVNMVDSWDASGEYKRHTVYAKLIKQYPEADKRMLNLTIEMVLLKLVD